MAESHSTRTYWVVFGWLFLLTIVEVGAIFLPIARYLIAILLVGAALSKASLVAMFYMHLKFERRTLGMIAITPLLLCVFLVFMLLPDHKATTHRTVGASTPSTPSR